MALCTSKFVAREVFRRVHKILPKKKIIITDKSGGRERECILWSFLAFTSISWLSLQLFASPLVSLTLSFFCHHHHNLDKQIL